MAEQRIVEQQLDDGRRIGEAGRLDQNSPERRHFAAVALCQKCAQRVLQIAAQRAADAAARQHRDFAVDLLDQQMIEAHLAELVDDDGAVRHARMTQEFVEKRGFAAAQESGDERDGHPLGRFVPIEQAHAFPAWQSVKGPHWTPILT